ncbi:MAG TPA: hypothetical protein VGZ49_15565 [Xanthobacteraceae bacterium]|jgi:hypothetical protein|nr:hypothetical protein [Xanthobacteraceae bacterium]
MTDTSATAALAAETEASRALAAEAAPDNPNPTDVSDDPSRTTRGPRERGDGSHGSEPAPAEPKPLERITAADRGRSEIAGRFKEKRAAQGGQVEFHGDMRDPSQTYGPYVGQMSDVGGQRTEETPQPAEQQQPTAEAAPALQPPPPTSELRPPTSEARLVPLKVHGVDMFLPEDKVIAEAQKSLAAGNLLESAKEALAIARQPATPDAGPGADPAAPDPYLELAQTIQLEDAAAAGTKLKQTIESETAKARQEAAREAARQVRIETELAASQKAMQTFEKAHPELASDEFARDAVTTQVQREINADLQAAVTQGILKELPRSQDERNGLHTQLRAFGAPVRPMTDIFDAAGTKYQTWRGGTPAPRPTSPQPPTTQTNTAAAPRVELTTARQERRAAIPTQPTNGTVPPRAPALPPEQTTAQRRSAAVMAMRKARGQIVA